MPRLLSTRTHFPKTTLAIGARTQKNCTERLSQQVDLHGLSAGLAAHSRKKPTPKKRPSAMGMSDAECVARNINKTPLNFGRGGWVTLQQKQAS